MFSLPSSALSLRRRSFIKKSMDSFGDDSCTVVEESSLPFDGDEDRPTSVVLHEPPKTYSAAPEPRRSALRAQSVCGSNERKDRSLGDESCVPRVRFGDVHIHTHGVELGYNPSVSWGPPLELSWDVISVEEYHIDSYEKTPIVGDARNFPKPNDAGDCTVPAFQDLLSKQLNLRCMTTSTTTTTTTVTTSIKASAVR